MARGRDPGDAIERRRGEVERVGNAGAQYFKISGEVEVVGPGESAISVNFPVLFVDKPAWSCGVELKPGSPFTLGEFPTCSVLVAAWHKRVRDDGSNIYSGAQFAISCTGPTDQVIVVQWHMTGVALRGPVKDED